MSLVAAATAELAAAGIDADVRAVDEVEAVVVSRLTADAAAAAAADAAAVRTAAVAAQRAAEEELARAQEAVDAGRSKGAAGLAAARRRVAAADARLDALDDAAAARAELDAEAAAEAAGAATAAAVGGEPPPAIGKGENASGVPLPPTGAAGEPLQATGESRREFLIRTGALTPFGGGQREPTRRRAGGGVEPPAKRPRQTPVVVVSEEEGEEKGKGKRATTKPDGGALADAATYVAVSARPASPGGSPKDGKGASDPGSSTARVRRPPRWAVSKGDDGSDGSGGDDGSDGIDGEGSAYAPSEDEAPSDAEEDEEYERQAEAKRGLDRRRGASSAGVAASRDGSGRVAAVDDGAPAPDGSVIGGEADEEEEEVVFSGGFRVPASLYDRLFEYQRTGLQWLWELHCQQCGGIIGDEMGLGKTIQAVAFLAALRYSGKLDGPTLVIAPATLLQQWKREFTTWAPDIRTHILHGSVMADHTSPGATAAPFGRTGSDRALKKRKASTLSAAGTAASRSDAGVAALLRAVRRPLTAPGVLLTSYEQVRRHQKALLRVDWEYVIADEGHKLRNPDAEITLVCKQLDTPRRLILSGSPMQNRLKELWSLFDFVFPGKLGTLPAFEAQFSVPIAIGGYASASRSQIHTAYRCASVLRDLLSPYLLRRLKRDVALQLPSKAEHVLFCKLDPPQRAAYEVFIHSRLVDEVLNGRLNLLAAVTTLRKICNHPDMLSVEDSPDGGGDPDMISLERPGRGRGTTRGGGGFGRMGGDDGSWKVGTVSDEVIEAAGARPPMAEDYGDWRRSGKMRVVVQVLTAWASGGHRALIFSQTRTMLDILERYMVEAGYEYRRMDGETSIGRRMALIDEFNTDRSIFVFLLTTRVGGLGVNLTGADRVLLFDPDWNPSTDVQARERAWRVGQTRPVTVYRLITSGTIEEKMLHRQIFKTFLADKVLRDPKQRRFFKRKHLRDLFSLAPEGDVGTETGDLFTGTAAKEAVAAPPEARSAGGSTGAGSAAGDVPNGRGQSPDAHAGTTATAAAGGDDDGPPSGVGTPSSAADDGGDGNGGGGGDGSGGGGGDAKLLHSLFDTSAGGLHSTMDHDALVESGTADVDVEVMEHEAARVAAAAVAAVRASGAARRAVGVAVPTWTGRSGLAGLPDRTSLGRSFGGGGMGSTPWGSAALRGISAAGAAGGDAIGGHGGAAAAAAAATVRGEGLAVGGMSARVTRPVLTPSAPPGTPAPASSSALLARMRDRAGDSVAAGVVVSNGGGNSSGGGGSGGDSSEGAEVATARSIVAFLRAAGGAAPSAAVVAHFRTAVGDSVRQMSVFKATLKAVAVLRKPPGGGVPVWRLRSTYEAD
ncbi:hypothetical protein MMPV_006603 [Pyropia vietnamensis]